ncbi:hypothetical protein [Duganella hordei]|uniref:hypothetical protein n=1 Tax=Duganella hordei TaxID=2865934 RepID=UPI0033412F0D
MTILVFTKERENKLHPVIQKTFGGLKPSYYFRHLFFGILLMAFYCFMLSRGKEPTPLGIYLFFLVSTLLYPYSRFVYESIVGFIMGENIFFVNAIVMMMAKIFTMVMCWAAAIIIAPIGLLYLYIHHSKNEAA